MRSGKADYPMGSISDVKRKHTYASIFLPSISFDEFPSQRYKDLVFGL